MRIKPYSKVIMMGDSITDCGRNKEMPGEGGPLSYGTGYVSLIKALLESQDPPCPLRLVNLGISGQTIVHLAERWQADVLDNQPDWLSIMIGINDVWRHFDRAYFKETHVSLETYKSTMDELLAKTAPIVEGMIVVSPYMVEPNKSDAMRQEMDAFGAAAKEVAARHNAIFVDTQAAFDRFTETFHPFFVAGDRIHPNLTGHMVIARAWVDAIS